MNDEDDYKVRAARLLDSLRSINTPLRDAKRMTLVQPNSFMPPVNPDPDQAQAQTQTQTQTKIIQTHDESLRKQLMTSYDDELAAIIQINTNTNRSNIPTSNQNPTIIEPPPLKIKITRIPPKWYVTLAVKKCLGD